MENSTEQQKNQQTEEKSGGPGSSSARKSAFGLLAFEAGTEFVFLIGGPLVAAVLIGKWLDTKYDKHFYVIAFIPLAIIISSFSIYRRIKDYKKMLK